MVDLFFYRSPEEVSWDESSGWINERQESIVLTVVPQTEKEEQAAIEQSKPQKEDYVEPYAEQPAFTTTEVVTVSAMSSYVKILF